MRAEMCSLVGGGYGGEVDAADVAGALLCRAIDIAGSCGASNRTRTRNYVASHILMLGAITAANKAISNRPAAPDTPKDQVP